MSELSSRQCVPCRGGVPALKGEEITTLLNQLEDWKVINQHHLQKSYGFEDFQGALAFVNKVGQIAEETGAPSRHLLWLGKGGNYDLHRTRSMDSPKAISFLPRSLMRLNQFSLTIAYLSLMSSA